MERDAPDRLVARVDDVDLVEGARQVPGLAHVVDGLADRPERRQRHQLPLHQAAGAVFGPGEALRHPGPLRARDRVQDGRPPRRVEVLEHGHGVVAVHVGDRFRRPLGADFGDQRLADAVLDMGQHVAAEHVVGERDQAAALVRAEALDQVGGVGVVQRREEGADPVTVGGRERPAHFADETGGEAVEPVLPASSGRRTARLPAPVFRHASRLPCRACPVRCADFCPDAGERQGTRAPRGRGPDALNTILDER